MAEIEIRGSGDRSYVFVHGTPSDRRVFHDLASHAPDGTAVVLLDLPDHGAAPDDPTASVASWERSLREAVDAAPGEVTVVGHSLGAWLIAAMSSRLPERARRFVSISGFSKFTEDDVALRRDLKSQIESGELDVGEPLRELFFDLLFGNKRTAELDAFMMPMFDITPEHWVRLAQRSLEIGAHPAVHFERPATLVHSTRDKAIAFTHSEELAERSVDAKVVPIDTESHMLQLTHAKELAEIIYPPH